MIPKIIRRSKKFKICFQFLTQNAVKVLHDYYVIFEFFVNLLFFLNCYETHDRCSGVCLRRNKGANIKILIV